MTNRDRAAMTRLLAEDIEESIKAREDAIEMCGRKNLSYGYEIPAQHTKEAVIRKITLLRQQLLEIKNKL